MAGSGGKSGTEWVKFDVEINSTCEMPAQEGTVPPEPTMPRGLAVSLTGRPLRAAGVELHKQHPARVLEGGSLAGELDGPQLSVAERREQLLLKVKADNAAIADLERELAEAQDAVRAGRSRRAQLTPSATDADDPQAQKYNELNQRDREMSQLIDTFDEQKTEESTLTAAAQAEIVRLLQAASRKQDYLDNTSGLSADRMKEVKADLNFKQSQMDNSAATSRIGPLIIAANSVLGETFSST